MDDVKDAPGLKPQKSVVEILGNFDAPPKKKLQFSRFSNQPTLNATTFWRNDFFQPLSLTETEEKAIGKSCFFCGHTSSINQYDQVLLDGDSSPKQFCVFYFFQLPRYIGGTTIDQKWYPSFLIELSQTEINSLYRYIILSNFVVQFSKVQAKQMGIDNEFGTWLFETNNELQGLDAAISANAQAAFKTLSLKNATFHAYLAEFLSYLATNEPENYANRMNIFQNVVIIPTAKAYSPEQCIALIKETKFTRSQDNKAFKFLWEVFNV